jgi:hypothetical protein
MALISKQNQYIVKKSFRFARYMVGLFLIVSLLLLCYVYYISEIKNNGTVGYIYTKYYIISFVSIFFWSVLIWLRDEIKLNIVLVFTSIIIVVYFVEVLLNFYTPTPTKKDTRTKYEVFLDMKSDGQDVVTNITPNQFIATNGLEADGYSVFPLGGISNKTTINCNEGGEYSIYKSDRYGFNNPDYEWDALKPEYLLIGDSFTEGACVQVGEEISRQISSITEENVINLGRGDNGPLTELATLIEYAKVKQPKNVIWIYFEGNDLIRNGDLHKEKSSQLLMKYLQSDFSQNLVNSQSEIDNILGDFFASKVKMQEALMLKDTPMMKEGLGYIFIEELLSITKSLRLPKIRSYIAFDKKNVNNDTLEITPLFLEILSKAKSIVSSWGGQIYFVYLPQIDRYIDSDLAHGQYKNRDKVISSMKDLNIPVIDIHEEVFQKHRDPLSFFPYRVAGHYNALGYAEVAEAIVDGIKGYEKSNK